MSIFITVRIKLNISEKIFAKCRTSWTIAITESRDGLWGIFPPDMHVMEEKEKCSEVQTNMNKIKIIEHILYLSSYSTVFSCFTALWDIFLFWLVSHQAFGSVSSSSLIIFPFFLDYANNFRFDPKPWQALCSCRHFFSISGLKAFLDIKLFPM